MYVLFTAGHECGRLYSIYDIEPSHMTYIKLPSQSALHDMVAVTYPRLRHTMGYDF